ncbi:MAG TPA: pantoate--beta-alanine ligase [Methylotenera sp.]|nr:pantoate--beta-alanine ligase [Methylotenera sp.]
MQIINTITALRADLASQVSIGQKIGFVPTMGNLHAGHIHLVDLAKQHANCVVVSIFVNPLQFSPTEDLEAYPRTLQTDYEKLKAAGCDIVFVPSTTEIYADFDGQNLNQTMTIMPPPIASVLCGATRLSHFAGVATVVLKLFNIVRPDIAVFGKKDFQQLFIIKEMVRQFNLPITIIAGETVREANGLALSSRNGYLNEVQLASASQLNNALQRIVNNVQNSDSNFELLENSASQTLTQQGWEVDYISVRSSKTLQPAKPQDKDLVVLGAAKIINQTGGKTRLIDNIEFCV